VEEKKIYEKLEIPATVSEPEMLYAVRQNKITSLQIFDLKTLSGLKDELLSFSLNLNIKTFRNYKVKQLPMKPYLQEHVFALLSLFNHGIDIFGTSDQFGEWLQKPNHFFDNDPPMNFLNTISGIKYTDDRLIAMEYGDNV
jgi:uncharacterized protein (DUF2384 family)